MKKHNIVKEVLDKYPTTRDNDTLLILAVWHRQGIKIPAEIRDEILDRGIAPESITRLRRKLRETGIVSGSSSVERERYNKFTSIHGNTSIENLDNVLC